MKVSNIHNTNYEKAQKQVKVQHIRLNAANAATKKAGEKSKQSWVTYKSNVKKIKAVGAACFKKKKADLAKAATTHAARQNRVDDYNEYFNILKGKAPTTEEAQKQIKVHAAHADSKKSWVTYKRNVKKIKAAGTACFEKQKDALAKAATTHAARQEKLDDLYQKQQERTVNVQRQYDTAVALQSKEHAKCL